VGKRPQIGIVDYGMGNLMSVSRAFQSLGFRTCVSGDREQLRNVHGLVLPGVGAFRDCMENLEKRDLTRFIREWVKEDKPFLGICLGLQLLFTESHEFGVHRGLDLFKGKVVRFPDDMRSSVRYHSEERQEKLKVPHMGWNRVEHPEGSSYFQDIPQGGYFYFVHSYYVVPEEDLKTCRTEYGIEFVSGIEAKNLISVQFHPEKSQEVGLLFLRNFARAALG